MLKSGIPNQPNKSRHTNEHKLSMDEMLIAKDNSFIQTCVV